MDKIYQNEIETLKTEIIRLKNELKKKKKYGLVWEDKPEEVVEMCKEKLPVLREIKNKEIITDQNKPVNLLIEGDNYHALSVLNYTHAKKVDVIYIDPPYNTGARDWTYNNNYVDKNDAWRHSKWLNMMEKRLVLAKSLLKPDGVLICAIDENEFHHLGCLLEQIFTGFEIHCVAIVHNPRGIQGNNFSYCHEYAYFLFKKGLYIIGDIAREEVLKEEFKDHGGESLRVDACNCFYPIYVKKGEIIGFGDVPDENYHPTKNIKRKDGVIEIWPIDIKGIERKWIFARQTVESIKNKLFVKKKKNDEVDIWRKKDKQKPRTVWTGKYYDASTYGSKLVNDLVPNSQFDFPKSIFNTRDCLSIIIEQRKNAIVLDYFAGSGTTGHAVMLLNKHDNGNRKYILCTNNEIGEKLEKKFKVRFNISEETFREWKEINKKEWLEYLEKNGICSATCYPRIKKVIEGHKDWSEITNIKTNLKYFKTDFVDYDKPTDKNKIKLTKQATEMLCIKEGTFEKIIDNEMFKIFKNSNHYTGVVWDQTTIPAFKKAIEDLKGKFSVYIFSLGGETFDEEFDDITQKVQLSPIPEAILRVYRRIFR